MRNLQKMTRPASNPMRLVQRFHLARVSPFRVVQYVQISQPQIRWESSSSNARPSREPPRPNPYKQFGRPFIKVFLGALFTYQVIYWAWEKLRLDEIKEHKRAEMKELEQQVDDYQRSKGITTNKNAGS